MAVDREPLHRLVELFNARNFDAAVGLFHPDAVWVNSEDPFAAPQEYRGHQAIRRYFEQIATVWEGLSVTIEAEVQAGEWLLTPCEVRGRGRTSGVETSMRIVEAWLVRDGLILHRRTFPTLEEARAAVAE